MDDTSLPEILYEDGALLCINKPAGLLSIRDGYDPLLPHTASLLSPRFGRLWIVHRLDRDTSGTLLLARTPEAHRTLNIAFEKRQVHKTYHAIVYGIPLETEWIVDLPLKVNGDRHHRTTIDVLNGKPAQTNLRVLKASGYFSLLEAQPITGYTHQIRAHLLAAGFPILADPLYKLAPEKISLDPISSEISTLSISHLALHAFSLEFNHPETNFPIKINAPYPPDFHSALVTLGLTKDS